MKGCELARLFRASVSMFVCVGGSVGVGGVVGPSPVTSLLYLFPNCRCVRFRLGVVVWVGRERTAASVGANLFN